MPPGSSKAHPSPSTVTTVISGEGANIAEVQRQRSLNAVTRSRREEMRDVVDSKTPMRDVTALSKPAQPLHLIMIAQLVSRDGIAVSVSSYETTDPGSILGVAIFPG